MSSVLFPVSRDYEAWFVEYLASLGFDDHGCPQNDDGSLEHLWQSELRGYRTEDKRLVIRPGSEAFFHNLPNFHNTSNNFQIYWDEYALNDATSNVQVLSFDHFLELVVWPSRDYHEPLKANEIYAPTAYNLT